MSEAPPTSDPPQGSVNTAPAAAGAGVSHAAQSSSLAGGAGAPPVQDSQQQAPKEAEAECPRPKWETAKDLKEYWKARKTLFTDKERAEAWEETAKIVKAYSDELVDRWNKEIDTLLVFAGLFSAILTAFNVQSYQLLTPAPATDPVIVALEKISAQLSSFSVKPPSVNSTQPVFVHQNPITTPALRWAVWLNALWFSSLIFSLAAASIGLIVKQWITEYNSGLSGTSRQTARLRQLRLASLQRWRVKEIVSILPVLLQIASGLFFAGLLVLLWNLNRTVAIVGTVFVGFLAVFSLATIILPSVVMHCSYLSPPSRVLFELTRPLRKAVHLCRDQISSRIASHCGWTVHEFEHFNPAQWHGAERFQRQHPWIYRFCKLLYPRDAAVTLAWRGMESTLVSRRAGELDGEIVETAYKTSMDTNYLRHAAICTTELTPSVMRICFQAIRSASITHWGEGKHTDAMRLAHPGMWSSALVAFMTDSSADVVGTPSALAAAFKAAYDYINPDGQHVRSDVPRTRSTCVDIARVIQHCADPKLPSHCKDVALLLLHYTLRDVIEEAAETKLGNDVRQYVASIFVEQALKRLDVAATDSEGTELALRLVAYIVQCVPRPGKPDYKADGPEYKAVHSQAVRALQAFSGFLSTPRALGNQFTYAIDYVFQDALRRHGEQAGLMSPELREVIISYLEAYEIEHGTFSYSVWYEFIEELNCKLAESSGKNTAVAVMESTLRRTKGLLAVDAASLTEDDNLKRFRHALRCLLRCIPPPGSSDCKPDDPVYKAVQERAVGALSTFSVFLPTSEPSAYPWQINDVFDDLREHGDRAGLMSAELRHAIVRYRDAYCSKYEEDAWYWRRNQEWIQQLKRELVNSEQNAPASNACLTSRDTDSQPSTAHTTSTVVQDLADTRTTSSQAAGGHRDAHASMEMAVNQSSASTLLPSSGHAAAMTNGESTGSVVDKEDTDWDTAEDERDAGNFQTEEASGVGQTASGTPQSPDGPSLA